MSPSAGDTLGALLAPVDAAKTHRLREREAPGQEEAA